MFLWYFPFKLFLNLLLTLAPLLYFTICPLHTSLHLASLHFTTHILTFFVFLVLPFAFQWCLQQLQIHSPFIYRLASCFSAISILFPRRVTVVLFIHLLLTIHQVMFSVSFYVPDIPVWVLQQIELI